MFKINKETVGKMSAEEYISLDDEQREYAVSIMTHMQRRLLKVRLTTHESRRVQKAFQEKRKNYSNLTNTSSVKSEERTELEIIDENYVLSGSDPREMSRRIRELGFKRAVQAYYDGDNPKEVLKELSLRDRESNLVSRIKTAPEALKYLRGVGYKAKR
jgi:hypothetical protein